MKIQQTEKFLNMVYEISIIDINKIVETTGKTFETVMDDIVTHITPHVPHHDEFEIFANNLLQLESALNKKIIHYAFYWIAKTCLINAHPEFAAKYEKLKVML